MFQIVSYGKINIIKVAKHIIKVVSSLELLRIMIMSPKNQKKSLISRWKNLMNSIILAIIHFNVIFDLLLFDYFLIIWFYHHLSLPKKDFIATELVIIHSNHCLAHLKPLFFYDLDLLYWFLVVLYLLLLAFLTFICIGSFCSVYIDMQFHFDIRKCNVHI